MKRSGKRTGEGVGRGVAKGWKRRKTARSGACTLAQDEKRERPRDKERGIAEGEKLRFTDRRTVTKREWSLRERRKLAEERNECKRRFSAFSFLHSSLAVLFLFFSFSRLRE